MTVTEVDDHCWWLVMVTDDQWHLLVTGDSLWLWETVNENWWQLLIVGDIYCRWHYFVTASDLQWWVMTRVGIRRQLILNDDSTWEMLTVGNADCWWRVTRRCRASLSFSKLMISADSESSMLPVIYGCWQWIVNADSHIWLLTVSHQCWQSAAI